MHKGWTEKHTRGDGETHKEGGTEKLTIFGTDRHTDRQIHRGSYRGGAHLKISNYNIFPCSNATRRYRDF